MLCGRGHPIEPLMQIISGVGLVLNGVLTLLGNILDGIGLGGILNGILDALGLNKLLGRSVSGVICTHTFFPCFCLPSSASPFIDYVHLSRYASIGLGGLGGALGGGKKIEGQDKKDSDAGKTKGIDFGKVAPSGGQGKQQGGGGLMGSLGGLGGTVGDTAGGAASGVGGALGGLTGGLGLGGGQE